MRGKMFLVAGVQRNCLQLQLHIQFDLTMADICQNDAILQNKHQYKRKHEKCYYIPKNVKDKMPDVFSWSGEIMFGLFSMNLIQRNGCRNKIMKN